MNYQGHSHHHSLGKNQARPQVGRQPTICDGIAYLKNLMTAKVSSFLANLGGNFKSLDYPSSPNRHYMFPPGSPACQWNPQQHPVTSFQGSIPQGQLHGSPMAYAPTNNNLFANRANPFPINNDRDFRPHYQTQPQHHAFTPVNNFSTMNYWSPDYVQPGVHNTQRLMASPCYQPPNLWSSQVEKSVPLAFSPNTISHPLSAISSNLRRDQHEFNSVHGFAQADLTGSFSMGAENRQLNQPADGQRTALGDPQINTSGIRSMCHQQLNGRPPPNDSSPSCPKTIQEEQPQISMASTTPSPLNPVRAESESRVPAAAACQQLPPSPMRIPQRTDLSPEMLDRMAAIKKTFALTRKNLAASGLTSCSKAPSLTSAEGNNHPLPSLMARAEAQRNVATQSKSPLAPANVRSMPPFSQQDNAHLGLPRNAQMTTSGSCWGKELPRITNPARTMGATVRQEAEKQRMRQPSVSMFQYQNFMNSQEDDSIPASYLDPEMKKTVLAQLPAGSIEKKPGLFYTFLPDGSVLRTRAIDLTTDNLSVGSRLADFKNLGYDVGGQSNQTGRKMALPFPVPAGGLGAK